MKKYVLEIIAAAGVIIMIALGLFVVLNVAKEPADANVKETSYNFLATTVIVYGRDNRTGLCFATVRYDHRAFANVECTEKVLSIINGKNSDGIDE